MNQIIYSEQSQDLIHLFVSMQCVAETEAIEQETFVCCASESVEEAVSFSKLRM